MSHTQSRSSPDMPACASTIENCCGFPRFGLLPSWSLAGSASLGPARGLIKRDPPFFHLRSSRTAATAWLSREVAPGHWVVFPASHSAVSALIVRRGPRTWRSPWRCSLLPARASVSLCSGSGRYLQSAARRRRRALSRVRSGSCSGYCAGAARAQVPPWIPRETRRRGLPCASLTTSSGKPYAV